MISIQETTDLLGLAIRNVLSSRKDEKFYNLVKAWNKKIVVDVSDMYPITIIFEGENIKFERREVEDYDVKLKTDLQTLLDLAFGRIGSVSAVIKGKLKLKGILKVGTLLKLMKVFFKPLKDVAKNPNINYFEQDKEIK